MRHPLCLFGPGLGTLFYSASSSPSIGPNGLAPQALKSQQSPSSEMENGKNKKNKKKGKRLPSPKFLRLSCSLRVSILRA
jgi:hypothetical protein